MKFTVLLGIRRMPLAIHGRHLFVSLQYQLTSRLHKLCSRRPRTCFPCYRTFRLLFLRFTMLPPFVGCKSR